MGVHGLRLGLGLRWVVLGVVFEVGWQSQGRGGWQRTRRRTQRRRVRRQGLRLQ